MNEQFLERMQGYLKEEYPAYVNSLQTPMYRGLRVNTSKITTEEVCQLSICPMHQSTICAQSFYLDDEERKLGNHPAHLAGLFYLQEPSASSAVEILDVQEGDWVLDMCAAPGGKSTQIAAKLNHTGFLVSNEIEKKRAVILMSNMERLGFGACMVTNNRPDELANEMKGWFDKVLVDAPCSGEGMFKKHSKAMDDWSVEHVEACAIRQKQILESAYEVLKQEGILVYSTCTYSMEENEHVIKAFLESHPDMELLDANVTFGRPGLPCDGIDEKKLRRILPMDQGEGHFIARLQKHGEQETTKQKELSSAILEPYVQTFFDQQLLNSQGYYMVIQDKVYKKQTPFLKFKNISIMRQGILCGEMIKKRFEPHQHFYSASLHQNEFRQVCHLNDEQCLAYLQGNVLSIPGYKGYTALTWSGYPIAFAKGDGLVLKNKYPKGMRIHGSWLF